MIVWINESLGVAPYGVPLDKAVFCLDVRDLVDKKGNDSKILRNKIKVGAQILRNGKKLVVCCDKGISRSVAVSIGIMCLLGKSFEESLTLIADKVRNQSINLNLLEDVRNCVSSPADNDSKGERISNVLVAGSTGFVGTALVKRLSNKYSLFCPKSNEIDLTKDVLLFHKETRKREIDLIIDVAHPKLRNSLKSLAQSILITRNILEISRLNDIPSIFLSSLVVFEGYCEDVSPLKSDLKPKPVSIYGQSKALSEELIRYYRELYGLNVTILRPSIVYDKGLRKTGFLTKSIKHAIRNEPITVHQYLNGFQKLDFLHVNDLTEAIEKSFNLVTSEDINLGTGKGISTLDIANLVTMLINSKSEINIVDIKNFTTNLVANTKKAKELLNWQAETNIVETLRDTLVE